MMVPVVHGSSARLYKDGFGPRRGEISTAFGGARPTHTPSSLPHSLSHLPSRRARRSLALSHTTPHTCVHTSCKLFELAMASKLKQAPDLPLKISWELAMAVAGRPAS